MDWRIFSFGALALTSLAAPGCTGAESRAERGRELYVYCAQCHGDRGEGTQDYRAPAIAGLERWYVLAQLEKFRLGARGDHPDDVDGLRMRPMARTLASAAEMEMVAEYVASLPNTDPPPTVEGDPGRGAELYAPCVQCHGERAEGNREMNAPPLTNASDWYLVAQLQKFKAGIRGTDAQDATGSQMRPNAVALDDQGMQDVVAYIGTLD
jgi:cytochrome c553